MRLTLAQASQRRPGVLAWKTACRAVLALILLMASPVLESTARADLDLQWNAPPGCPNREEVLGRVRGLAGSFLDQTKGLSASGRIESANGRFHLTILVREGSSVRKRVIASDSCAPLAGAAAITMAILMGVDVGAVETRADDQSGANGDGSAGGRDGEGRTPGEQGGGRRRQLAEMLDLPNRRQPPVEPVAPGSVEPCTSMVDPLARAPRGWRTSDHCRSQVSASDLAPACGTRRGGSCSPATFLLGKPSASASKLRLTGRT